MHMHSRPPLVSSGSNKCADSHTEPETICNARSAVNGALRNLLVFCASDARAQPYCRNVGQSMRCKCIVMVVMNVYTLRRLQQLKVRTTSTEGLVAIELDSRMSLWLSI